MGFTGKEGSTMRFSGPGCGIRRDSLGIHCGIRRDSLWDSAGFTVGFTWDSTGFRVGFKGIHRSTNSMLKAVKSHVSLTVIP